MTNRNLLAAYISAENACLTAAGRVSDKWMNTLVDRTSAARRAFLRAPVVTSDDAFAWIDFAHAWVRFNEGCEVDSVVARILAIEAGEIAVAA